MKISIITITYNSEKTLEDTIQSVARQNYPDLEYIIVDGGSKDATLDIVKKTYLLNYRTRPFEYPFHIMS